MGRDIYTEPASVDFETIRNLGPLTAMVGVFEGNGVDTHPVAEGALDEPYREQMVVELLDP